MVPGWWCCILCGVILCASVVWYVYYGVDAIRYGGRVGSPLVSYDVISVCTIVHAMLGWYMK
jgi:hypothetical protein